MEQNTRNTILEVLEIIGYTDDREAFTDGFITNCKKQALFDVLEALLPERQVKLKERIKDVTDVDQAKAILETYVSTEVYNQALEQASKNAFIEYIEAVLPGLSNDQTSNLQAYLKQLAAYRDESQHLPSADA